jgi:hypothetical protein
MTLDEYFDHQFVNYTLAELAKGYLARTGWFYSLTGEAKDMQGPVPWMTYAAVAMLRRIVKPDFKVFEYGSGSSTLWWSRIVSRVVSVDHNPQWIERLRPGFSDKVVLVHKAINAPVDPSHMPLVDEFLEEGLDLPTSGNHAHDVQHGLLCREFAAYASELLNYPRGYFNIVVVDGMARVLTAWLAARQLGDDGVVLFDNSDRWQYNSAYKLLTDAGFAKIDFWGLGPINRFEWCTSLFVKNLEVLRHNPLIPRETKADMGW